MTKEEKQLLLIDLCARLPYGVKIQTWYGEIITSDLNTFPYSTEEMDKEGMWDQLNNFKPYLRPMSSMTEKENEELKYEIELELQALEGEEGHNIVSAAPAAFEIDFYNKHHFDYRGLIPMGLALEAPNDMYKTE